MDIRVMAVVEKGKTSSCCFILPLRPIPTYMVRNSSIPKKVAEDSESKHEGAWKLQWDLDVCVVVDHMVKEAEQEE